jgi:hypothetical protein
MTPPSPLEQQELLGEITQGLVADLPDGWHRLIVDYALVDGRVKVGVGLRMADGSSGRATVPRTLAPLFRRLRRGDDWHRLELIVDAPGAFQVRFHR